MRSLRSRRKLKPQDFNRFREVEPVLFRELAEVVCATGVLPEKELHECWQMATLVHQSFPEVLSIVDVAAGHGLLAWILVLLDRDTSSPKGREAVAIDITRPKSALILSSAIEERWPSTKGSVHYVEGSVDAVWDSEPSRTLFVSAHGCGSVSDRVLMAAVESRSSVAIMPCCHSFKGQEKTLQALADLSGLSYNCIDPSSQGIDKFREDVLAQAGYVVSHLEIDPEISSYFRIIVGRVTETTPDRPNLNRDKEQGTKRVGEIRAYEKARSIDLSDRARIRELSERPEREWRRVFDLSFWIAENAMPEELEEFFSDKLRGLDFAVHLKTLGVYLQPDTQRKSQTIRFELSSHTFPVTKDVALSLRKTLCELESDKFVLRV